MTDKSHQPAEGEYSFDLSCGVKDEMAASGGMARLDLAGVINKTMAAHTARKGCRWVDGAEEAILASPEFVALARLIERYEICQAKAA